MKKTILYISLFFLCFRSNAQEHLRNSNNFQIHPGTTMAIFGDFENDGVFTDAGLSVTFNGNRDQSISGSGTTSFYDLIINNSLGVTLHQPIVVKNTLSLTSGPLNLNSKTLYISDSLPTAIVRANGYILSENTDNSNRLKWKIGNNMGTYTFPFGTSAGTYIPFVLNHTSGDIGNVTVSTFPTATDNTPFPTTPTLVTNVNDSIGNDNSANTVDRFWQIDKDGPGGAATLTFTVSESEASSLINLKAKRWNSALDVWDAPLPGQTSTSNSVTVTNVSSFSPWTITGILSTLPISMLSFSVRKNNDHASLNWVTATEINNFGFDIEKSVDLKNWNKIGFIAGAGNSNRLLNYEYNDDLSENIKNNNAIVYYRLKQIDFDGAYKYSETKSVILTSENNETHVTFALYPNPASQYLNIKSNQPMQQFQVCLYNQNGIMIRNYAMKGSIQLNLSDLVPAIYQITIFDMLNENQYQYKLVKMPN